MDAKLKDYIETTLQKIAVLDESDVAYEHIEIYEFQQSYENGAKFQQQNGDFYAIALLNAITLESASEISREIKKNKNLSLSGLIRFVDQHRLKCYIEGTSKSYSEWQTGDVGVAVITYDDVKKQIIPSFTNESALNRAK